MRPETIARLRFSPPMQGWRPPSALSFSTLCRTQGGEGDPTLGNWTLLIELWGPIADRDVFASVQLLSNQGPRLRMGMTFTLFEGPHVIGSGEIVIPAHSEGARDRDVLAALNISPVVGGLRRRPVLAGWRVTLACGHEVNIVTKKKPTRKIMRCLQCEGF